MKRTDKPHHPSRFKQLPRVYTIYFFRNEITTKTCRPSLRDTSSGCKCFAITVNQIVNRKLSIVKRTYWKLMSGIALSNSVHLHSSSEGSSVTILSSVWQELHSAAVHRASHLSAMAQLTPKRQKMAHANRESDFFPGWLLMNITLICKPCSLTHLQTQKKLNKA